jgi:membrane associated rhomboid family serine protease
MPPTTKNFGFSYALTPVVKKIIIANVIFFVLSLLQPRIFEWFAFQPSRILFRPWGLATYMFLHGGIGHLFWNMVGAGVFGPALENRWGGREFLKFYFCCGLGGAALHFLSGPTSTIPMIGASGAVFGVGLAFAMIWPNAPIALLGSFFVRAKYLAGFYISSNILFAGIEDGIARFTHLGGLLAAFIYLKVSDQRQRQAQVGATSSRTVRSSGSSASQSTGATVQPSIQSQKGTTAPPTSGYQHDKSGEPPAKPGSLDTHLVVKITQAQAAQGCKIRLKTGGGEQVELPIPSGTTAGAHLRVAGRGIRKGDQIGDQWVRVNIEG